MRLSQTVDLNVKQLEIIHAGLSMCVNLTYAIYMNQNNAFVIIKKKSFRI